jgi:hypothetical protein
MQITGLTKLVDQLRAKAAKSRTDDDASVIVGYTAAYALYVHEKIEMKLQGLPRAKPGKGSYWDPQGRAQAKFLEAPARMHRERIAEIVRQTYKKPGATLAQALLMGGLFLQRESMLLVPVDTGNLKASAFTRLEEKQEGGANG